MRDDDEPQARKAAAHRVGESLDALSLEELTERIALLHLEIARIEAAQEAKRVARDQAGSIFRL